MATEASDTQREDFLRPRLVGSRFDDGGVPLEVLKDLAVIEEMMFEVAKRLFVHEHGDRQRAPRKFFSEVSLKLTGVASGSAVPVIGIEFQSNDLPSVHSVAVEYLVKARDAFLQLLGQAEGEVRSVGAFPEKCLSYFDRFGRSLRDDEYMEFTVPGGTRTARLTKATRRKLVLMSSTVKEISEEFEVRATVPEADQEKMTFTIALIGGQRVAAPIPAQHLDTVLEAFNAYAGSQRVVVRGVARFSRTSRLLGFDSVEHVELLDPLDVSARLEELALLQNGWLEGEGLAPPEAGLLWLAHRFERHFPEDLPLPHIYPTPDGHIQAEWTLNAKDYSLEVNLQNGSATWYGPAPDGDEYEERSLNLDEDAGWENLVGKLRASQGTVS